MPRSRARFGHSPPGALLVCPRLYSGSILRIQADTGDPAPGYPFIADPSPEKQRALAYGLRNPFPNGEPAWNQ